LPFCPLSDIDHLTGLSGEADLAAVSQHFESDARRSAGFGIDMRNVGQMNRRFLVDDTTLHTRGLALVALHHVHAGDKCAIFARHHLEDFALAALVAAADDHHAVALLDAGADAPNLVVPLLGLGGFLRFRRHHSTSGASEMIFMWFFERSSRVTGPKMRVPIGSFWLFTSTAALLSKRMRLPSGRRTPCAVRTTTAFSTSPFFTRPRGIASFTLTTIVSPTSA